MFKEICLDQLYQEVFPDILTNQSSNFTLITFSLSRINQSQIFNSISKSEPGFESSVLLYKPNLTSIYRLNETINENSQGYQSNTIKNSDCELKITNNQFLKIVLYKTLHRKFEFYSQNLKFSMKNPKVFLSLDKIQKGFSISRCLADLSSETSSIEQLDQFTISCIFKELQKRRANNLEKKDLSITFEDTNKDSSLYRELKIKISVHHSVLNIFIKPAIRLPTPMNESDPEDVLRSISFRKCVENINKKIYIGQFFIGEKEIFYKTNFHISDITRVNMTTQLLIKKDIDIVYYYWPLLDQSLKDHSELLETLEIKFSNPKISSGLNFSTKTVQLSPSVYEKEKQLLDHLSQNPLDLFIPNRLQLRKITFLSHNFVQYPIITTGESFESFAHDFPREAIHSILNFSDILSRINIKFKNNKFPITGFNWYEERPIYTYQAPLCDILEYSENDEITKRKKLSSGLSEDENSDDSFDGEDDFKKSLFFDLLDFHSQTLDCRDFLSPEEVFEVYESLEFILIDEGLARERMNIYESNNSNGVVKYRGICRSGNNIFLFCDRRNLSSLTAELDKYELCLEFLKKFSCDLLTILEFITLKNTNFTCFDEKCVFFKTSGKIKLEIKSPCEIKDDFKSPEVKHGRSFRFSIVYSYSKVIEFSYCYSYCIHHGLIPDDSNILKSKPYVYRDFPWIQSLITGCTEAKVARRWTVRQIKDFFSLEHI